MDFVPLFVEEVQAQRQRAALLSGLPAGRHQWRESLKWCFLFL